MSITKTLYKTRNYWKNLKNGWRQSLVPSLHPKNKTLALVTKNYSKTDIKVFSPCPASLDPLALFHELCPRLSE